MGNGGKNSLIASFQNHYAELLRLLTRRTGDGHHAADVVQETYFRLVSVQQSGQVIANHRSFIMRVAQNLSIDHLRRDSYQRPAQISDEDLVAVQDSPITPDVACASKEALHLLDQALQELPFKVRQALLLHRVEGLSQVEIARQLGVSESMVVKYVAQALKHCRAWKQRVEAEQ